MIFQQFDVEIRRFNIGIVNMAFSTLDSSHVFGICFKQNGLFGKKKPRKPPPNPLQTPKPPPHPSKRPTDPNMDLICLRVDDRLQSAADDEHQWARCCCGDDGRWWTCEKEIFLIERLIQLKIKERDSLGFFFTLRIKDGLWFSSLSPSLSLNHLLACKESHRILVQHSHICK